MAYSSHNASIRLVPLQKGFAAAAKDSASTSARSGWDDGTMRACSCVWMVREAIKRPGGWMLR
jgi:hypothetical protein